MGLLIAWHYRTSMVAKLADHTYVTCGNRAKGWACWGGKIGGAVLRQGAGSTQQADRIAEPNERAVISCYLINGVCHQAANRILFPAGITARGARGYAVSEALYGTYGRPRNLFGLCRAPFNKHSGVTGDFPECTGRTVGFSEEQTASFEAAMNEPEDPDYDRYLAIVDEMYASLSAQRIEALDANQTKQFQLALFKALTDFRLGVTFRDSRRGQGLMEARDNVENQRIELEQHFEMDELTVGEFVSNYNSLIEEFQNNAANTLSSGEYFSLFQHEKGDTIVLGDPEIAAKAYGDR